MTRASRLVMCVLGLVATAALAAPAEQGAAPSAKPTIILVHGAFETDRRGNASSSAFNASTTTSSRRSCH